MRWLLFAIVFEIHEDGSLTQRATVTKLFASEAACDDAGKNFRGDVSFPQGWKSISMCIPEDFSVFESEAETRRR